MGAGGGGVGTVMVVGHREGTRGVFAFFVEHEGVVVGGGRARFGGGAEIEDPNYLGWGG